MGTEWPLVSLAEVAEEITVGHVGPMTHEYIPRGVPFLRSQDISSSGIRVADARFVSEEFHRRLAKSSLVPGDVVIVRTGRPGTAAVVGPELSEANCADLVIVRPGPKLDSHYLCAFINSIARQQVTANLVGAVQQHFNVRAARRLQLRLPPHPEQRAIAQVLRTLDDKIDSNARVAKGGLDVMMTHFDRRFGPSNAARSIRPLRAVADVVLGQSPPGTTYSADPSAGMPLVQGMGVFGDRFAEPSMFTSSPTKVVGAGALLMTVRAPVGSLNVTTETTCVGRGVAALVTEWPAFVECSLRKMEASWQGQAGGTIYPSVNGQQVRDAPVVAADWDALHAFEAFAAPFRDRALALHRESRRLAVIRDALLPHLVSGRIRVPLT